MKLSDMYGDEDSGISRSIARGGRLVRSAAGFPGCGPGLREMLLAMSEADDEKGFNEAFESLFASLSETTARYLQTT